MNLHRLLRASVLFILLFALAGLPPANPVRAASRWPVQISAGGDHTCVLYAAGDVGCWGSNAYGQLNVPAPNSQFVSISAGLRHTCGWKTDHSIVCWGDNHRGQASVPALSGDRYYISVSAGDLHTCALVADGNIICWGDNLYGQRTVPAPNSGFTQVAAGGQHTCGLKGTQAVCWGENTFGQTNVAAGSYQQIAAGRDHTCGLTTDGHVNCWGNNNYGQVSGAPARDGITQISAGYEFSCARFVDGGLTCWGYDSDHQVSNTPADFENLQVASGLYHACAVRTNGIVQCWGGNAFGQAPVISLSPLPDGETGAAYHATVTATGGTQASLTYTYTLASGWLPAGVALSEGGELTGTSYQAGTYHFTLRAQDDNNYTGTRKYDLTILPGTPTVSLSVTNSPLTYTGQPQPAVVALINSSAPGTLANVRYNGSAAVPTAAGTYAVTADFLPNDTVNFRNRTGVSAGNLVIQPAVLTVRAGDKTRFAGQPNPPLTYSINGFVNGETVTSAGLTGEPAVSTTAVQNSPAGHYPITVTQNSDPGRRLTAANYTFAFTNGTLTVVGQPGVTISVTNSPKTYTGLPQPAVVAITGTTVPGTLTHVRYNGSAAVPTAAGTYAVTVDFVPDDSVLYSTVTDLSGGDLVIQPVGLTVRADDQSRAAGRPNPPLTYTISGFVNGETAASAGLTGEPEASTTASAHSPFGRYPITITQNRDPAHRLSAANYIFVFGNGTLRITQSLFLPCVRRE